MALVALVNQLKEFDSQIDALECQLAQIQKGTSDGQVAIFHPRCWPVGPIAATTVAATVADPAMFRAGREFAAAEGSPRPYNEARRRLSQALAGY